MRVDSYANHCPFGETVPSVSWTGVSTSEVTRCVSSRASCSKFKSRPVVDVFLKNTTAVPFGVIPVANSGSLLFLNCSGPPVPSAACRQRLNTPLRFELKMIRLPSRVHSGCWSSPGSRVSGVSVFRSRSQIKMSFV